MTCAQPADAIHASGEGGYTESLMPPSTLSNTDSGGAVSLGAIVILYQAARRARGTGASGSAVALSGKEKLSAKTDCSCDCDCARACAKESVSPNAAARAHLVANNANDSPQSRFDRIKN